METRKCSKCKNIKNKKDFNKNRTKKNGFRSYCRECEKLYRQINKEKISQKKMEYYTKNYEKQLLKFAKQRAKKKNLPFDITEQDINIPEKCPVLGIPLFKGDGVMIDNSPNLDRIIPELGYVQNNVRVISQKANRIKSNATLEEIILVLKDFEEQQILLESRKEDEITTSIDMG